MSTTAVSFRKGNTQENEEFAGVAGEIVADLGTGQSSDENATIILHTGDSVLGGVRMARKDCKNLEWSDAKLSELSGTTVREGFVWNDLGNLSQNAPVNQEEISGYLQNNFNLTSTDGKNLDTYYITGEYNNWTGGGTRVATIKLNNIDDDGRNIIKNVSYDYWEGTQRNRASDALAADKVDVPGVIKPLARADMSNVTAQDIADRGIADINLSNVDDSNIVSKINNAYSVGDKLTDYEDKLNKEQDIWTGNKSDIVRYPSLNAVSSYVDLNIENCANRNLDNITSWSVATRKETSYIYEVKNIGGDATAYNISQYGPIQTDITNTEMTGGYLIIQPKNIDSHGVMTATIATPTNGYFSNSLSPTQYTYTGHGMTLIFSITSREIIPGKLMLADLSNSEIKAYNNSNALIYKGIVKYDITTDNNNKITEINSVNGQLYNTETIARFGAKYKSGTGAVSTIESYHYTGGDIENPVINKYSSIVVSNESAYLNKNIANENAETLDSNHELLNRSEIVTYVGNQIDSAIQQVISTAVVFKGIVANETLLPSSNQMNGDLYWITAFSSNPPSGMIEGRSGSAIWVQPSGSVGSWSYEMDSQNVPDGVTLKYTTTATSQVLSVKLSGAQNGVANAIQSTSDGLYVKTPTYLPALPQADGVYHLYVDNGTYTWINDARLVVTGS